MNSLLQNSIDAIHHPDVQHAMKLLGKHGLGVFLPHIHTDHGMESLPKQMMQFEQGLRVSFVPTGTPALEQAIPVGWVWDNETATVAGKCYCCAKGDKSPTCT